MAKDDENLIASDGLGWEEKAAPSSEEEANSGGLHVSPDAPLAGTAALEEPAPARVEPPHSGEAATLQQPALARVEPGSTPAQVEPQCQGEGSADPMALRPPAPARVEPQGQGEGSVEAAPLQGSAPVRLEPQRYKVQFTASEEYVQLFEEAKALLSCRPQPGLAEIHFRALELLVATLKKQKYAVTARPRKSAPVTSAPAPDSSAPASVSHDPANHGPASHGPAIALSRSPKPQRDGVQQLDRVTGPQRNGAKELEEEPGAPRQRGRHIPAAVRCAVFDRDGGRCTYVSASGARCRETCGLELHHLDPYALGGEHSLSNVTIRCRCHNGLAAEEELGREFLEQKRGSLGHESARSAGAMRVGRKRLAVPSGPVARRGGGRSS